MTNSTGHTDNFESRLGNLLEARASSIKVHPDVDAITSGAADLTTDSNAAHTTSITRSGRRSWLLAAAALLIVAIIGGAALLERTNATPDPVPDNELAAPAGLAPEELAELMDGLAAPEGPGEVIIWLEPEAGAADIQAIGDWLDGRAVVRGWSYVDADETWAEFQEFWADQPEVLDSVRPEQLPTSYRVFTNDAVTLQRVLERSGLDSIRQIQLPNEANLAVTPGDALYLLPANRSLPETRLVASIQAPADVATIPASVLTIGRPTADGYDQISRITLDAREVEPPDDYVTTVIDGRTLASPPNDLRFGLERTDEGYLTYDSWGPISPDLVRAIRVENGEMEFTGPIGGIEELTRRSEVGGYRASVSLGTPGAFFFRVRGGELVPRIPEGLPADVTDDWMLGYSLDTRVADSTDNLFDGLGGVLEEVEVGGDPGYLARIEMQYGDRNETVTQLRWFRAGSGDGPNHLVTLSIPGLSGAELIDYALALEPVDADTWQAAVATTAADVWPPSD